MKALLEKLHYRVDLNTKDVARAMVILLSEKSDPQQKAEFLTLLHKKGETAEEIAAFVEQLIERALDPMLDPAKLPGPLLDVCGTGGSTQNLCNVSTTIMFILAAGGATVVKHGNRSVTSS